MASTRRAARSAFPQLEGRIAAAVAPLFDRRRLFDALHALAMLDAAGCDTTLSELALAHERARRAGAEPGRPEPLTLRAFFERFHDHYREEQTATRGLVRWAARVLCRALGPEMPVEALSAADVREAAVPFASARTYNGFVKIVGTALRWGNREGLTDLAFAGSLERRPTTCREPAWFPPGKVEKIFRASEAAPGPLLAAVGMRLSLGFFAGVRSVEIERAAWEDLDLDGAVLRIPRPKGYTSGRRPRLVELEANAVAWLRRWRRWTTVRRRGRPPAGPLVPRPDLFTRWKRETLEPAGLSWDGGRTRNVMRHTYATMHVGAFRNAAATALNLGHGRSTDMLEKHYRGLVPKAVASAYWNIFPSGTGP
ncbi:MAG: hypothetical protein IJV65_09095 [Kiritimatiellae bacterium]|nr:hypothetical protein [Kiritimatiellia bacterium]